MAIIKVGEYQPIPVSEAQAIAEKYSKDQVLIFAWDKDSGLMQTTTYGKSTKPTKQRTPLVRRYVRQYNAAISLSLIPATDVPLPPSSDTTTVTNLNIDLTLNGSAKSAMFDITQRRTMLIKAALTGDVHHNCPNRTEEAHRVLEWMLEDWKARGVNFIGIAGDWNEVPPSERDQAWTRDFLGRCAGVAHTVLTYGNHDGSGVLNEFHLQHEFKYPITVVTQPDVIRVETDAGSLAVACVPFVWKAHLLAQIGPVSPEESDSMVEAELTSIFRGLGVRVREMGLPTVALIHGKWRGSKLNEDQPNRPLGMELAIPDIGLIDADFYCIAHIHLAQETEWDGAPIATPSSCFYVDYGESKHKKGYILARFAPREEADAHILKTLGPGSHLLGWERIPTPVTPMLLAEYRWENEMFVRDGSQAHESDLDVSGADVRLRYHYPKAEEKAAKGAAGEFEKQIYAQGAVRVKLDPIPIPTQTTRSLAIVKAGSLTEKARLLWASRGLGLSEEEEQIGVGLIEELQTAFGFGKRLTLDAGIHVKQVRMKGWRCFPGETSVDFDAIEGDVIAVSGPNGTGKSLFWELAIPGALYRELPTHGNIGDHSIARDTFVETVFEYEENTYTVSQIIDGQSGTGSSSLKIGKTPVFGTEKALRTEYDQWSTAHLPPFSLVKSTTFMPQESKGILGMGTKDRKALILRAKGAERYEVLAEAASKRALSIDRELTEARAKLQEIGTADLDELQVGTNLLFADLAGQQSLLKSAENELSFQRDEYARVAMARSRYEALLSQRNDLDNQAKSLRDRIGQIQGKIEVNQETVAEKNAILGAVDVVAALQRELASKSKPEGELRIELAKEVSEMARLEREVELQRQRGIELTNQQAGLSGRISEIEGRIRETRAIVADAVAIRAAVKLLRELQTAHRSKLHERAEQQTALATLGGELAAAETRLNGLTQRQSEIYRKKATATEVLATKSAVIEAVSAVASLTREVETVTAEISRYREEVEYLQNSLTTGKEKRISGLRDGYQEIILGADPIPRSIRARSDDDDLEAVAAQSPELLLTAKSELANSEALLRQTQKLLTRYQAVAARLPEIETAEKLLTEAIEEVDTVAEQQRVLTKSNELIAAKQSRLVDEQAQAQTDIHEIEERIGELQPLLEKAELLATAETKIQGLEEQRLSLKSDYNAKVTAVEKTAEYLFDTNTEGEQVKLRVENLEKQVLAFQMEIDGIERSIEVLRPTASKATSLAEAQVRVEEFLHQKSGLDKELEETEHKRDGIVLAEPPPPINLAPFEASVLTARDAVTKHQTDLVLAEKELTDAQAKEDRRQELAASVKIFEKTIDRWNLVERTLGRDGLQAEVVAAMGDEINELANELLRASGNTKYTIDLKTTKMTKDGKREIEGCPINVYNAETGEWQEGATLSPGQRAFVNLPLSLTLAMIGCLDSAVRPTLFLDEPTAGLDEENRKQYVAMMRHAVKRVGASKLFFITHNQELIDFADSHLFIHDGLIEIARGPV